MDVLHLARWQFAITLIFHFFFVPLSIGLVFITAVLETAWVRTKNEVYLRMTKFWGRLFLINFALGIVTGLVQEFQFGMNWSSYSRFVGDVFGAPLAIEGLAAFFLESTFIGLWIFGWNRLSDRVHLATIWIVTTGTILSAFFILAANSWMQHPVGYRVNPITGRAELHDFGALLTNPTLWTHFPHTIFAALVTGGMFVIGVSAWHLLRDHETELFRRSASIALVVSLVSTIGVVLVGHWQMVQMTDEQPMKAAAAESLWNTTQGAGLSLFAIPDQASGENLFDIELPHGLSLLSTFSWNGTSEGINDLQRRYVQEYGPGSYIPMVAVSYWTFRTMVGIGFLMILIALVGLWLLRKGKLETTKWFLWPALFAIALPYIANTTGWMLTEMGRQPWVVYGVMLTSHAASPAVGFGMVLATLVGFTVLYGALGVVDAYLLAKYARSDPPAVEAPTSGPTLAY
jgi:cytochrome d ubiquinol oxidase subunit I